MVAAAGATGGAGAAGAGVSGSWTPRAGGTWGPRKYMGWVLKRGEINN